MSSGAKTSTAKSNWVTLRLRESLRAQLEGIAKRKAVSLNQEIVGRIDKAFTVEIAEANQRLLLAELKLISARIDELSVRLGAAEALLKEVRELDEGGYRELSNDIDNLRSAIIRGHIDPEDNK